MGRKRRRIRSSERASSAGQKVERGEPGRTGRERASRDRDRDRDRDRVSVSDRDRDRVSVSDRGRVRRPRWAAATAWAGRDRAALAFAFALHVLVLGALSSLPPSAPPGSPEAPREAALEIDFLSPPDLAPRPTRPDPPDAPRGPLLPESPATAGLSPSPSPDPTPELAREASTPAPPAAPSAPAGGAGASKGWSADPGPPGAAPSAPGGDRVGMPTWMGGRPLWTEPGGVGPDLPGPDRGAPRGPDPEAAGKALRGTLRAKDRALGLDLPAATTVENAVVDAVRGTATPLRARATFEIKLAPDGRVEGGRVLGVTGGDAASWNRALEKAKAALGKGRLPMGARTRGATVRVKVESKVLYPGGTAKRAEVKPVCANEIAGEILAQLENPSNPEQKSKLRKQLADLPCIPIAIAGQLDPVNLGARAHRVVHATREVLVEGEQALPAGPVLPVDTRPRWMQKKLPSGAPSLYEFRRKPKWERERDKRRGK